MGRSNQNSEVNREFAKEIKAVADKQYPGLIKDIFIGKGNYNQDLSPNAILIKFGTHTISKERALESTGLMADVVSTALYGTQTGSAKSESASSSAQKTQNAEKTKGSVSGIVWLIVAVVVAAVVFLLAQTGGGRAMTKKLGRNVSEMTGGLMGKRPEDES